MKKILYLHAGAEMYGADKILLELVEGIDKTKFEPLVILPEKGVLVDELLKRKIDVSVMPYPIVRRKYFTPIGIIRFLISYLFYASKLVSVVRTNHIQIVHVNTTAVWEGVWIKLFSRAKIIWHVHEIITHPRVVFRFVSFLLQHFSDKIIAVSDATANHVLRSGLVDANKVFVIHNGIESTTVTDGKGALVGDVGIKGTSDYITIGMVGRINSWKGQADFLAAVEPLLYDNSHVRAMMIGSTYTGEEGKKVALEKQIQSFPEGVQDRISLIPFQKNIADYYSMFDIFVLPSTSPDPFPTVVLEAMANSLPVVAYAHGGVTEMVQDDVNGKLVQPNNVHKLSLVIEELINNSQERADFGKMSAIRQHNLFDITQFISSFESIYDEVVR